MTSLAVVRSAPEPESLSAHGTVIHLPARVLGVMALQVSLGLVALAADVAQVGTLLLPLVHHLDVRPDGGLFHPLGAQVARLLLVK